MAVRIKDWMIPYTWWQGIEITNNHVINVLLREMNNLIHVNENRELYVDLQLDDWIEPTDDFPVGVTTGKILEEDWWQQNGIILNRKTTSWDYVRLIYANDWKLYYDPWTWIWNELGGCWQSIWVATASALWVIKLGSDTVQTEAAQNPTSTSWKTYPVQLNSSNQAVVNIPWTDTTYQSLVEQNWWVDVSLVTTWEKYNWNHKQDKLTAWNNITIDNNNVISATIPAALTYKWNVNGINDLPASWNTVWDTYFVEWQDSMYSWDGTQWNYVGWSGIDVTNLFNKTIDDSDDIVQWSLHLFCSPTEKAYRNGKQDALVAWANITIDPVTHEISATNTTYTAWNGINISAWNQISNTLPFDPENSGTLAQVLKKTSTWYRWSDEVDWFDPENAGSTGQVLKKTATGYAWANESWWWGGWWWGWNFNPSNIWTPWQVLTKTAWWYAWETSSSNVKLFTLNSLSDTTNAQHVLNWTLDGNMPIIKYNDGVNDVYYCLNYNDTTSHTLEFKVYMGPWQWSGYTYQVFQELYINYNWTTVSTITHGVEELNKTWIWTQAEYDLLTPETWVIYNIIPSS